MNKSPAFTIIMSTYNRMAVLPRAIKSVLNQTFSDFEFLLIDNGSTDDTRFVVDNFRDPRLRYILNPKPTNSCDGPRNLGIEMAKGELVSFLDDDDIWYPERLEKVKEAFDKNPDASAVCHNEYRRINGRIDTVLKHGPFTIDLYERLLYERNCLSSCATTIKKDLLRQLGGFDLRKEFYATSDYDLWIRMAAKRVKIHFIEEPLGEFTLNGNNWSIVNPAFESKVASLIKYHILEYEKKPIFKISERGMWRLFQLYCVAGRAFMKKNHYKNAIKYYYRALFFIILRPKLIARVCSKIKKV